MDTTEDDEVLPDNELSSEDEDENDEDSDSDKDEDPGTNTGNQPGRGTQAVDREGQHEEGGHEEEEEPLGLNVDQEEADTQLVAEVERECQTEKDFTLSADQRRSAQAIVKKVSYKLKLCCSASVHPISAAHQPSKASVSLPRATRRAARELPQGQDRAEDHEA